ncbi:MAG: hypothetical protein DRQ62_00080 [Gammaproteobacteria bacterium]|nr:MAG: hypothetical protein DRQ62_00080 [Gammaproteobacteria bacterium]
MKTLLLALLLSVSTFANADWFSDVKEDTSDLYQRTVQVTTTWYGETKEDVSKWYGIHKDVDSIVEKLHAYNDYECESNMSFCAEKGRLYEEVMLALNGFEKETTVESK